MTPLQWEALESAIAATPSEGPPAPLPLEILCPDPPPHFVRHDPENGTEPPISPPGDIAVSAVSILTAEQWSEQWVQMHEAAGGMLQMRTGNPCPLGDQARSAYGQIAAQACYDLFASTPALRSMFLSPESTMIGQLLAVGLHGVSCVNIVRASMEGTPENAD